MQFRTEIPECNAVKLWTIVSYDDLGNSKAANNVLPYEFGDIFIFDACICFSFYPFTEVIRGDEQEFLLGSCGW